MKRPRIGSVGLGKVPRIVAIVDRPFPLTKLRHAVADGAGIFEIRVDCFTTPLDSVVAYVKRIRDRLGLPLICTIRETPANRAARLGMFERLLPLVDAVDIEIDTPINRGVIKMAKGKTVIVSQHDFAATPSNATLGAIVKKGKALGADIIKIAATANTAPDVSRILRFAAGRTENLVVISMGEMGSISRVLAHVFGSLYTYGFITKAVAPGQLSVRQLAEELKLFYPGFKLTSRLRRFPSLEHKRGAHAPAARASAKG